MTLTLLVIILTLTTTYFLILSFLVASLCQFIQTLHFLLDFRDPVNTEHDKIGWDAHCTPHRFPKHPHLLLPHPHPLFPHRIPPPPRTAYT